MLEAICVMSAGAIGALSRWQTDRLFKHLFGASFPLGTLTVNVVGCLLFGLFMQLDAQGEGFSKTTRLLVTSGFLGAFTTFSTFGYDTFNFFKTGNFLPAVLNIVANLLIGVLAVWLGAIIAKTMGS